MDGGALCDVMSPGGQVLNLEDLPTQSSAIMSSKQATRSCKSRPSVLDMDGGALYDAMFPGRQVLNSEDLPTQSSAVMSPERATMCCKSHPSALCFFSMVGRQMSKIPNNAYAISS
jgi:hypothetical protein